MAKSKVGSARRRKYTTLISAVLDAGGAGYVVNDKVRVEGMGGNIKPIIQVITVDGGGAVLTFSVISGGNGVALTGEVHGTTAITPGGAGFAITITVANREY